MYIQYCLQDIGAENKLKQLKYSIANSYAIKKKSNIKIAVDYCRLIGRYPFYDISSLKYGTIIDELNLYSQGDIKINNGLPIFQLLMYLKNALTKQEPVVYFNSNIFATEPFKIIEDSIYFWNIDNIWMKTPWGIEKQEHIDKFELFCIQNKIINHKLDSFHMFNCDFVYIPQKYIKELYDKLNLMLNKICDIYKNDNMFSASCVCAGQICLSILIQEIERREFVQIRFALQEEIPIRRVEGMDNDVAGSLRLLFD